MEKIIMHYDMDCFYASIEIRDNPKLKNKPLVVGTSIITTASYEARKYGLHSAMSIYQAKKLCPNLISVPVDKEKYIAISDYIHSLVLKITEKVEFIALDEGYIDLTDVVGDFDEADDFAMKFRKRIKELTKLTCSVGIGYNKLSAKIASDINKPGGQYVFRNELEFSEYISNKDIKIIQGVGKKLRLELQKMDIKKVKDILPYSFNELVAKFGKSRGELLYLASRGIDYSEVDYQRITHSIGNEVTYRFPIESEVQIKKEFQEIFEYTYERLKKSGYISKTISVKIKFRDNEMITRSKTLEIPTDMKEILYGVVEDLVENLELEKEIRLLGVSFGNLTEKSIMQLSIFN